MYKHWDEGDWVYYWSSEEGRRPSDSIWCVPGTIGEY
jgi:hypothetical protein